MMDSSDIVEFMTVLFDMVELVTLEFIVRLPFAIVEMRTVALVVLDAVTLDPCMTLSSETPVV